MRGKSWLVEEERQLRELVSQGFGITQISQVMGKPRMSVKGKIYNLGLSVVVATGAQHTVAAATAAATSPPPVTSSPSLPNPVSATDSSSAELVCAQVKSNSPLPTIEEQLHVLNAAIVALQRPGISHIEVTRQSKIIEGVKVYNDLFAKFVDYRGLEIKVLELEKRLANEKNQL